MAKCKLNSELTKNICENIKNGIPFVYACKLCGISKSTFYNWYNKGEKADDGIFKEFYDEVEKAKAEAIRYHVDIIFNAGKNGNWRASAWWLERVCDEFNPKKKFKGEMNVNEGKGLANALFTDEELEEIKENLKNIDDIDKMIENLDDDFSKFE